MCASLAFLRFVARAALNYVGGGFGGDFAVDVLPEIAKGVWDRWGKNRSDLCLRGELQEVARLEPQQAESLGEQAVAQEASELPDKEQNDLAIYLSLIPASIRQSQRRPSEPRGRTISQAQPLQRWDSLVPLLPTQIPRFRAGQQPLPNVDWVLEELLGMGGFGEVWKAKHSDLASIEPVALKFCQDPTGTGQLLKHEAQVLDRVKLQVKHPGIVPLTNMYKSRNCLEYKFINGGELTGIIREARPYSGLDPLKASRIIHEVAEIVGFCHRLEEPIVHRDLKPANVLVEIGDDGKTEHYRVADFGIGGVAARLNVSRTNAGINPDSYNMWSERGTYTPLYASPQQIRGDKPDPRDDVYALGVIWFQLLTGDLQAGAPTSLDWPNELTRKGTTGEVIYLLASCFHQDKTRRPSDAASLAEQLKSIIDAPIVYGPKKKREPRPKDDSGKPRVKARTIPPKQIVWSDYPQNPVYVSKWTEVFQKTLERAVREGHDIKALPVKLSTYPDNFRGSVIIKVSGPAIYVDSHGSAKALRERMTNVLKAMGKPRKFMLIECGNGHRFELP